MKAISHNQFKETELTTQWRVSDLSLHVFVELHRFLQIGQTPPQICLIHHLALVLHDLVPGLCHNMLDLIETKQRSRLSVTFKVERQTMREKNAVVLSVKKPCSY